MSLTVDGVWKAGIWEASVWAKGVWYEPAQGGGGGTGRIKKEKKKRGQVIRWSDLQTSEDRQAALAQALALAAKPVEASAQDDDSEFEEEDALITALVMSRMLH